MEKFAYWSNSLINITMQQGCSKGAANGLFKAAFQRTSMTIDRRLPKWPFKSFLEGRYYHDGLAAIKGQIPAGPSPSRWSYVTLSSKTCCHHHSHVTPPTVWPAPTGTRNGRWLRLQLDPNGVGHRSPCSINHYPLELVDLDHSRHTVLAQPQHSWGHGISEYTRMW